MNTTIIYYYKDTNVDLFLNFNNEARNKDTEIRFAPYLQKFFNFIENDQTIREEDDADNGGDDEQINIRYKAFYKQLYNFISLKVLVLYLLFFIILILF